MPAFRARRAIPYLRQRRQKKQQHELGYPVLVRPSYVLGGQGMQIAINDDDIDEFIGIINRIAQDHPILVDKYLVGQGNRGGCRMRRHRYPDSRVSWSISSAPASIPETVSPYIRHRALPRRSRRSIVDYTRKLAKALHVIGLINIQFIVCR